MYFVYTYRDTRPDKNNAVVYVGKGSPGTDRHLYHWKRHCVNKGLNNLFNALRRLNLAPIIEIVFTTEIESDAYAKEIELIKLFGRRDLKTGTLFNLTSGGDGAPQLNEDAKRRMLGNTSSRNKALWQDPVWRDRQVAAIRENAQDPSYRVKLSESILKSHANPEVITKISEASKMHWQDPEYVTKRTNAHSASMKTQKAFSNKSKATKLGWTDEKTRSKRTAGIKASRTPELKAQISASCLALWDNETRAKQSAKMKEVSNTPEVRAAKSAAAKLAWAKRKMNK